MKEEQAPFCRKKRRNPWRIEKKCNGTAARPESIWKMNSCMTRSIVRSGRKEERLICL